MGRGWLRSVRRLLTPGLTAGLTLSLVAAGSPTIAASAVKVVDRPPTSTVTGAATHTDALRDLAYAGGRLYTLDDDTVRVFAPGASGNAVPQRTIDVDVPDGQHGWAIAVGTDGTTWVLTSDDDLTSSTVLRYEAGASGAAVPTTVDNTELGLVSPLDIAERPTGFALLDNDSNSIRFLQLPAGGDAVEVGGIEAGSGTQTQIFGPSSIETAPDGRLVVTGQDWVSVFAAGAEGDVAPLQYVQGAATRIGITLGAGLDSRGNLYVGSADSWSVGAHPRVLRFAPGATGDVAPATVLTGTRTGLTLPYVETLPAGGVVLANFDPSAGYLEGPVATYRPLGPYAAPARPTGLKVTGKKQKRRVTWQPAAVDADVPVTGYTVRATCVWKSTKGKKNKKSRIVRVLNLRASVRTAVVKVPKARRVSCTVAVVARNEVGSSPAASTRFVVRR